MGCGGSKSAKVKEEPKKEEPKKEEAKKEEPAVRRVCAAAAEPACVGFWVVQREACAMAWHG